MSKTNLKTLEIASKTTRNPIRMNSNRIINIVENQDLKRKPTRLLIQTNQERLFQKLLTLKKQIFIIRNQLPLGKT